MLNCSWKNPIKEMLQPLKKSFVIKRKFSLIAFEIFWVLMILMRLNYALQFKLSGKLRHLNFPPWCGIISLTDLNPSSVPHISYHIHMQRALKLQQGIASPGLLSFGLLFSKGAVSNCVVSIDIMSYTGWWSKILDFIKRFLMFYCFTLISFTYIYTQ